MIQIIGGGLAGCEAAWQAVGRGVPVTLHEMRPVRTTRVHQTDPAQQHRGERGTAIDHEIASYEAEKELIETETKAMAEGGIETITLEGEQADLFLTKAYDIAWARLKERDPTMHDELKELFFEDF